jgi:hypothetical protein
MRNCSARFAFVFSLHFSLLVGQAAAQCADQPCNNLQTVFNSAMIDFREYRDKPSSIPNLSTGIAKLACQMNLWANNVKMYVCYAQIPLAAGDSWFSTTVENAKRLQANWTFKVNANGENRYADGGPENCEVTPTEGPYIGQCPFHAQMVRQPDGSANLYLWINSFSSPYLLHHAPPPKVARPPASVAAADCDDFCRNFKKAFAARENAFADLGGAKSGEEVSPEASVAFPGARKCTITRTTRAESGDPKGSEGIRFVCFWQEPSATVAEARFHDLVFRVQALVPESWSARQQEESNDVTGANVIAWLAVEPGARHDVRVYLSGTSVALHISAWAPSPLSLRATGRTSISR